MVVVGRVDLQLATGGTISVPWLFLISGPESRIPGSGFGSQLDPYPQGIPRVEF